MKPFDTSTLPPRTRVALALSFAAFLTGLSGCGWHAGLVVPEGAESIGVEVFTRTPEVLERGLEARLAEELSAAVSDLVGIPLAHPSRADLVIRGEISNYSRRDGVHSIDNLLLETGILIQVQARLVDRVRGTTEKEVFEALWTGYALGDPSGERIARNRALRYLAETLVLELFQQGAQKEENPVPLSR